ncbi:MAG: hypothetical protein ABSE73_29480, partial [Planctomycetota bacterium]
EKWTPPPGLTNFPTNAKRMKKEKEQAFLDLLKQAGSEEQEQLNLTESQIAAMGPAILPYAVAGCYDDSVGARTVCMKVIGGLNGRNAIKQAIEVFYAAMPATDQAQDFQQPFIQAIKETLTVITGKAFITTGPDMPQVQDGLRQYIDWYNKEMERLPPQLGEMKIDATDPDYAEKVKQARALNLAKKSFPQPVTASEQIQGTKPNLHPPLPTVDQLISPADKTFKQTVPTVKFDDFFKR